MERDNIAEINQDMRNIPNEPEELSQWDRLPFYTLLEIYSNLDKSDQFSMPMVCRNWSNLFEHPELWRRISFPLFQTSTFKNVEPPFKEEYLIKKYGHLVKHLTVKVISSMSVEDYRKQMDNLELLYSKTQLEYLELEQINGDMKSSLEYRMKRLVERNDLEIRDKQHKGSGVLLLYQKTSLKPLCVQYVWDECVLRKDIMEYSEDNQSLQKLARVLPPPVVLRNLWIENKVMNGKSEKCFLNFLLNRGCNKTLKELRIQWQLENESGHVFQVIISRRPNLKKADIANS